MDQLSDRNDSREGWDLRASISRGSSASQQGKHDCTSDSVHSREGVWWSPSRGSWTKKHKNELQIQSRGSLQGLPPVTCLCPPASLSQSSTTSPNSATNPAWKKAPPEKRKGRYTSHLSDNVSYLHRLLLVSILCPNFNINSIPSCSLNIPFGR